MPIETIAIGFLLLATLRPAEAATGDTMASNEPANTVADPDFALQGEFLDRSRQNGQPPIGLQVVALGKGQFLGVLFDGGLPGAGANPAFRRELLGTRQGDSVELRTSDSDPSRIVVRSTTAELHGDRPTRLLQRCVRVSPSFGLPPPPGARVYFRDSEPHDLSGAMLFDDGFLRPGARTSNPVRDFRLHLEFRTPFMPDARGQARGNSGVYIQERYEVQILDSFGLPLANNECGALYKQQPPDLNLCLPPGQWQTYDITFRAARYDSQGNKLHPARVTVLHNGYPIHCNHALSAKTGAGKPEGAEPRPILFQDHGNPVAFANIWLVELAENRSRDPRPGLLERIKMRRAIRGAS